MDVFSGYCTTQAKVDCGDREQLWRTDHSDQQQQQQGKNVRTFQSAVGSSHHQHQHESGIEGRFSFSGRRPHPASSSSLNERKETLRGTEPPAKKTSGLFGGLHRRRGSHILAKHHQNQQEEDDEYDAEDVGKGKVEFGLQKLPGQILFFKYIDCQVVFFVLMNFPQ